MSSRRIPQFQRRAQLSRFDDGGASDRAEQEAALYAAARDVHRERAAAPARQGARGGGGAAMQAAVERGAAQVDWAGKATKTSRRRHFYHGESEGLPLQGMSTHVETGSMLPAPGSSADAYAESSSAGSAHMPGTRRGVDPSRDLRFAGSAADMGGHAGRTAENPIGTGTYQRDLRCAEHSAADWITTAQRQQLSVAQAREAAAKEAEYERQQAQYGGQHGGGRYGAQPHAPEHSEQLRAAIDHDTRAPSGRRTYSTEVAPRDAPRWVPPPSGGGSGDLLGGVLDGITNTVLAAERRQSAQRSIKAQQQQPFTAESGRNAVLFDEKNRQQILLNYNPRMAGTTKAMPRW